MKVIVAGGRDLTETRELLIGIETLLLKLGADSVVSGCARGADSFGEKVAGKLGLQVLKYPAAWVIPGTGGIVDKSAGLKRNEHMAKIGDALIALPGGRGTADMIRRAKSHGLAIYQLGLDGELLES